MIFNCKKHIITACFICLLPLVSWSVAPVVDESENFALIDGQQVQEGPVVHSKYGDSQVESRPFDEAQNENDTLDNFQEDTSRAFAKEDKVAGVTNTIRDNAKLIDKIQSLQHEVQDLRGQLEVQAHDLKLVQQQQVAFYKDLDARISGTGVTRASPIKAEIMPVSVPSVSRVNPADEQISYLAAYELVKNNRHDDALNAMRIFVQKYPRGGYTANAHYWLGELYLLKKEYTPAVAHFNVVLHQFPTSNKSAASMLKTGYAYAAQGNNQEAKKYLQQVVRAYPGTSTAQLADSKLRAI